MLPKRFRHFDISELLGKGGMGEVWLAYDTSLERKVALKVLSRSLVDDPAAQGRLLDEARSCSRVTHPNIAAIYSIEEDGGLVALCLEYIEGRTLKAMLADGPLSLHQVSRIGSAIAAGMQAAHDAGIVHRDLKPANVMMTPRGEVKVMDFGLALRPRRVVDTAGPSTYGTVQYMSPEQARGEELGPASDIFSFGSLLYEMVAGIPAFDGKNDLAVLHNINGKEPTPLRELRRDVPPALEHAIRRCLAKEPQDRWASMQQVADELAFVAPTVEAGPKDLISELATNLGATPRPGGNRPQNSGRVGRRGQPAPGSWAMGNTLTLESGPSRQVELTGDGPRSQAHHPEGEDELVERTVQAVQEIRDRAVERDSQSRPAPKLTRGPAASGDDALPPGEERRRRIAEQLEARSRRRQLLGNAIGLVLAFLLGVGATVFLMQKASGPLSEPAATAAPATPPASSR